MGTRVQAHLHAGTGHQPVTSHHVGARRIELKTFGRAVSALNRRALSPAQM